jgi:hypothetical protein
MDYGICIVPAAPVRKEPSHRSEMVNQLLFGETIQVFEKKDEWFRIVSTFDQYEGWVTFHLIELISNFPEHSSRFVSSDLVSEIITATHPIHIPAGSSLTGFDKVSRKLWKPEFRFEGRYSDASLPIAEQIVPTAFQWLNAPYLWGGKTLMGTDCSGFVQTVFKICVFTLQRDAWQQQQQGTSVTEDTRAGDVAFFHNEHGRVIHVGIIISHNRIIHASGKVRIDELDTKGILNHELKKYTHHLHSVKRMSYENKFLTAL